jgi:hypothetical protein
VLVATLNIWREEIPFVEFQSLAGFRARCDGKTWHILLRFQIVSIRPGLFFLISHSQGHTCVQVLGRDLQEEVQQLYAIVEQAEVHIAEAQIVEKIAIVGIMEEELLQVDVGLIHMSGILVAPVEVMAGSISSHSELQLYKILFISGNYSRILSRLNRNITELDVRRAFTSFQLITILEENHHSFLIVEHDPLLYEDLPGDGGLPGPGPQADL